MCILNGRIGDTSSDQYTCLSVKGKSVVDYAFVPHNQLHFWNKFQLHQMRNIIHDKDIPIHEQYANT